MTTSDSYTGANEPTQSFSTGQKLFNRYKLDRVLGQGGMGVVWLARDEELDREIALKFVPSVVINDRSSLNDLKRETKRTLELTHPNIVRTYDFVQDGALAGISMEYVDSDTLRNRKIDMPDEVFQPAQLGDWVAQLCEALDYAHLNASIVHRDLKPANLLINARNQVKVADFGISRSLVESVTQVTGMRGASGTLVYMSPQQLSGDRAHPLDDVYAVGATLYELCTRKPPFYSGDISGQVYGKVPPSMAERRVFLGVPTGEIPENWETTVAACLAKDPAQRPRTAGEIAVRLGLKDAASLTVRDTVFLGSAPTSSGPIRVSSPSTGNLATSPSATPPPLPEAKSPARLRRNPAVILGLMGAGFVVLLIVAWIIGGRFLNDTTAPVVTAPKIAPPVTDRPGNTAPRLQLSAPNVEAATPADGRGSLFVETDPPGARVKIDDRPAEKTPVPLRDLPPGRHVMTVMMDGFEDYTTPVEVQANQTIDTGKIKLVRSTGWLNVTTTPPGAEITVKGPDAMQTPMHFTTPWSSDKLPAGDYEVTVARNGWQPIVRNVVVARDQAQQLPLDLTGGSIEITSVPSKAKVLVNGKEVGVTPCRFLDLQPGALQFSLTYAGYQELPTAATIEPGQTLKLEKKLVKTASASVAKAAPPKAAVAHTSSSSSRSRDDDRDSDRPGGAWDKAGKAINMFRAIRGY